MATTTFTPGEILDVQKITQALTELSLNELDRPNAYLQVSGADHAVRLEWSDDSSEYVLVVED